MIVAIVILSIVAIVAALWAIRASKRAESLQEQLSTERATNAVLKERTETLAQEQRRLQEEADQRFWAIAQKTVNETSDTLRAQNTAGLEATIRPLKEAFEAFKKQVQESNMASGASSQALQTRLNDLMRLNDEVKQQTRALTDALKGNSRVQGDWGEMILENILERCGLRRGEEFDVQNSFDTPEGRLRPDVIVHYPEGRDLIIDSKVSIQDYLGMLNATDEAQREAFGKAHVQSVRKHIGELRTKKYQDHIGRQRLDYVLMFIPHEGAYLAAMELDDSLWATAYEARVVIVSPTHLLSLLRMVEHEWRAEKQDRNAQAIAAEAEGMLEKLTGFLEEFEKVNKSLEAAHSSWETAAARLSTGRGNVINRVRKIIDLGAKSKKSIPARFDIDQDSSSESPAIE